MNNNNHYKLIDTIKKNYFLNLNSQNTFNTGDNIFISFNNKEKKEYNFNAIIIAKNINESNKNIYVHRNIDHINFWQIINLKSPLIKDIQIIAKKRIKRAKMYYTRFFAEKAFSLLF